MSTHTHRCAYAHSGMLFSPKKEGNTAVCDYVVATMWMDLKGIMPSEINQTEKDKYYVILLTRGISKTQSLRNRE